MGKLNELNAEAKKLGYKYHWEKGADKKSRVSFSNSENSFEGFFDKDGYSLNWTKVPRFAGPSKESVDLAEKFYKAYSELQRKIEPGRNDWKQDEALLKELKEADDGKRPSSSIWGRPDHCKKLAPGVYTVDTPSHGGIMVSASVAHKVLSPETLVHCSGLLENGYYQFEEDCDAAIPLVEMYRKGISEGYSWNEGRQAEFYELAQEEVLKWNAPIFESWIVSREKEGPSADKGYEPKPVALEDIVGQMDFRLEVTPSGKLMLWDLQRNEYLDNERLDGSPFASEPEKYAPSNLEFSSAEEVFDRLDSFIRDYFYADMESELEKVGAATGNASSLYDLCELWKAELGKGSKELSKGELDMALGIVNPDTVIMPKGFKRSGKEASADKIEKVTCENFQQKLAARAERDAIKTAQSLLSEMDEAEREKFNGIVRSQGLKKPEDVDAFFAALAKGTAAFEPKERKRTPPEQGLGM